jgi:hypothetical protein
MNLPTILIGLIIAVLFVLAVRYLVKNGTCAACEDKEACQAAKKMAAAGPAHGCGGMCASCRYYEYELKALPAKQQTSE